MSDDHSPDCDTQDFNLEGIRKPCNCKGPTITPDLAAVIANDLFGGHTAHEHRIAREKVAAHLAPTLDALAKYRAHVREKIYVDATPDADLPLRILEAHIDESETETNPPQLGEQMNQWRDERNAILLKAIAELRSLTTLRQAGERLAEATDYVRPYCKAKYGMPDDIEERLDAALAAWREIAKETP